MGQRRFEIELAFLPISGLAYRVVQPIRDHRGQDHENAHREEPYDQCSREQFVTCHCGGKKRYQRDTSDAIRLETIGSWANAIACIVARAISDDTGVLWIIFRQLENDLHQVRADIRDLGEDATTDTQRACAK